VEANVEATFIHFEPVNIHPCQNSKNQIHDNHAKQENGFL